jgi:hypothetical protein
MNKSGLRSRHTPIPVEFHTHVLTDWFITIQGSDKSSSDIFRDIQSRLGNVSFIMGAGCEQIQGHCHAVIRLHALVTSSFITNALAAAGDNNSLEPVKTNIDACQVYIESQ